MVDISSNIDNVLKSFKKKANAIKLSIKQIAEELANQMSIDMQNEINSTKSVWQDVEGSNMREISNVLFDIKHTKNGKSVRIEIGSNLQPISMSDGSKVNPIYFIEFGFGIYGETIPSPHSVEHGWAYNINGHTTAWLFMGNDGEFHSTIGTQGINFIYNTMQKYKEKWKDIFFDLVRRNLI